MIISFSKGRLTNVYDVPVHAPWLFTEPDLNTQEAQDVLKKIPRVQFSKEPVLSPHSIVFSHFFLFLQQFLAHALNETHQRLSQVPDQSWRDFDFSNTLHAEQDRLGYSAKIYMKTLRYALTGMKVRTDTSFCSSLG